MLTRNEEIYDARVEKGRTLQSIADQHGISRERVRQITQKLERQKTRVKTFPTVPERIDQIEWPVRVLTAFAMKIWTRLLLKSLSTTLKLMILSAFQI